MVHEKINEEVDMVLDFLMKNNIHTQTVEAIFYVTIAENISKASDVDGEARKSIIVFTENIARLLSKFKSKPQGS